MQLRKTNQELLADLENQISDLQEKVANQEPDAEEKIEQLTQYSMVEKFDSRKIHFDSDCRASIKLCTRHNHAGIANQRNDSVPSCISFSAFWWSSHSKDSASNGFLLGIGVDELPCRYARTNDSREIFVKQEI